MLGSAPLVASSATGGECNFDFDFDFDFAFGFDFEE